MNVRKCRPQKVPNGCDFSLSPCACSREVDKRTIFRQNVRDVASAIAKILKICGIVECKARAAKDIIIDTFVNYIKVRQRVDVAPRKQLRKEDLIHSLGTKCEMSLVEAQLTYSVMKRAFKAFYFGTNECGIRNPQLASKSIHNQECLWVHAAKRTAQVFAEYEGMFFSAQKKYEELIKRVYICLHDRLMKRENASKLPICCCKGGTRKIRAPNNNLTLAALSSDLIRNACGRVSPISPSSPMQDVGTTNQPNQLPENILSSKKCNCPKLICDCSVDLNKNYFTQECSQGPFKCRWIRIGESEPLWDPCVKKSKEHICPIDCRELSELLSETEGDDEAGTEGEAGAEAICEDVCEDIEDVSILEEETEEDDVCKIITQPSIEPSCTTEAPVPDNTVIMLPDKICYGKQETAWENEEDTAGKRHGIFNNLRQQKRFGSDMDSKGSFGVIKLSDGEEKSRNLSIDRAGKNKRSKKNEIEQQEAYAAVNLHGDLSQKKIDEDNQRRGSDEVAHQVLQKYKGKKGDQNLSKSMEFSKRGKKLFGQKKGSKKGTNKKFDGSKSGGVANGSLRKDYCSVANRNVCLGKVGRKVSLIGSSKSFKKTCPKSPCKSNQEKCSYPKGEDSIDVFDSDEFDGMSFN